LEEGTVVAGYWAQDRPLLLPLALPKPGLPCLPAVGTSLRNHWILIQCGLWEAEPGPLIPRLEDGQGYWV
jgi:hypothetical protein